MSELAADNLELETTQEGRIIVEPGYLSYLRNEGFIIESVESVHSVHSDSRDMAHIVAEITTYDYPRDHPELDYAQHKRTVRVCDCWSYRQSSNDVSEPDVVPGGSCKHVESCFMSEKAKADENQAELGL